MAHIVTVTSNCRPEVVREPVLEEILRRDQGLGRRAVEEKRKRDALDFAMPPIPNRESESGLQQLL